MTGGRVGIDSTLTRLVAQQNYRNVLDSLLRAFYYGSHRQIEQPRRKQNDLNSVNIAVADAAGERSS